jgi:hypothetical protein
MPHDQQAIQQTKRNRWDDEQIHRRDAVGMIVEKCFPTLGRQPYTPNHIFGHAGLPDFDTELEQTLHGSVELPERIGDAYLADQLAYFERHRGPATTASRLPAPIQPKTRAMPTNNSVRLHDRQRIANLWKQPIETSEYQVVEDAERKSLRKQSAAER